MKPLITYSLLIKVFVLFLLVNQLWVNIAPYCAVAANEDIEMIELYDIFENEKDKEDKEEKEEKKEIEEKEKEIQSNQTILSWHDYLITFNRYQIDQIFLLANHSKINTPPPKGLTSHLLKIGTTLCYIGK